MVFSPWQIASALSRSSAGTWHTVAPLLFAPDLLGDKLKPRYKWTHRQMIFMGTQKLSPQGQRLRTIILTVPIMAATSGVQPFLRRFPVKKPLTHHVHGQWYCTNDLCSKNPSANSLAPANATQTGESSSLAAKNQLIPERSGSNSIYCIIFIRIWTPPPSRRPYVDVSQLYISVCRRSSMLLFKLPIGGRNGKEIISTLEAAASVTASAAGASARRGCVLG